MTIHCPLCGRKHYNEYCMLYGTHIPEDIVLIECGDDENDCDFEE